MFYAVYNDVQKAKAADSDLEEVCTLLEESGAVKVRAFEREEDRDSFYFTKI